ncbi:MAG TPA: hypothetical protein VEU11_04180 [Terriglobales bacterium]|nr:hypothetical protein [Terriglobales bacterium]
MRAPINTDVSMNLSSQQHNAILVARYFPIVYADCFEFAILIFA